MVFAFLAWGIVAGYFAGFLGVGAGVLLMPFLAFMNIPYHSAVDASLMAVFASSATSSLQHYRINGIDWEPCLVMVIPGVIFALLGSIVLIHLIPPRLLEFTFALLMFLNIDLIRIVTKRSTQNNAEFTEKNRKKYFIRFITIGSLSGLMASLLGIGGGLLIVSLLIILGNFSIKEAVKTSVIVMVFTTFFSLLVDIFQNTLPLSIGFPCAIGAIIGGFLGTIALKYISASTVPKLNYFISFILGFVMLSKVLLA